MDTRNWCNFVMGQTITFTKTAFKAELKRRNLPKSERTDAMRSRAAKDGTIYLTKAEIEQKLGQNVEPTTTPAVEAVPAKRGRRAVAKPKSQLSKLEHAQQRASRRFKTVMRKKGIEPGERIRTARREYARVMREAKVAA